MAWWDRVDWSDPINRDCPLNQGLVGWWMGAPNCYGGTRLQDLLNHNHGTLTNMDPATDWVGTQYGPALDFDGTDDRVTASSVATSQTNITIMVFGEHNDTTQRYAISAGSSTNQKGPHIGVRSGTQYRYGVWGGMVVDSTVGYSVGVPHAWQMTVTPSAVTAYCDGNPAGTSSTGLAFTGTNGSINIGCLNNITSFWNGPIYAAIVFAGSSEYRKSAAPEMSQEAFSGFPDQLRWLRGRSMVSVPDEIINIFQKNNNKILTGSSLNFRGIKTGGNL